MKTAKIAAGYYEVTFDNGNVWNVQRDYNGHWLAAEENYTKRDARVLDSILTKRETLEILAKIEADEVAAAQTVQPATEATKAPQQPATQASRAYWLGEAEKHEQRAATLREKFKRTLSEQWRKQAKSDEARAYAIRQRWANDDEKRAAVEALKPASAGQDGQYAELYAQAFRAIASRNWADFDKIRADYFQSVKLSRYADQLEAAAGREK